MIHIRTDGRTWAMAEGHAGYAPFGQDIVCAAVSTLWQTLEKAVFHQSKWAEAVPILEDNEILIRAPNAQTDAYFQFFVTGVAMIAREYPDNVRLQLVN